MGHQQEMMQQDANGTVTKLKTQILQLQASNDVLNEQLQEVLNKSQNQNGQSMQQQQAFELQMNNLKNTHAQQVKNLESKVSELEGLNNQQRNKFNEFYEQYKKKIGSIKQG